MTQDWTMTIQLQSQFHREYDIIVGIPAINYLEMLYWLIECNNGVWLSFDYRLK